MLQEMQALSKANPLVQRLLYQALLSQLQLRSNTFEFVCKSLSFLVLFDPNLSLLLIGLPLVLKALIPKNTTAVNALGTAAVLSVSRSRGRPLMIGACPLHLSLSTVDHRREARVLTPRARRGGSP